MHQPVEYFEGVDLLLHISVYDWDEGRKKAPPRIFLRFSHNIASVSHMYIYDGREHECKTGEELKELHGEFLDCCDLDNDEVDMEIEEFLETCIPPFPKPLMRIDKWRWSPYT